MRHAPRELRATSNRRPLSPSRRSCAFASVAIVPSQPEAFPDVPANPSLQPEDGLPVLGQAEVSPPASDVSAPGVPQLVAGSALAAPPHLPHLRFESLHALRGRFDLPFAVQSKAQELAFPNPPFPALGSVDLQSQMLLDPVPDRGHRPLRRRRTAYVDVAVIGVPAERCPRRSSSLSSASR